MGFFNISGMLSPKNGEFLSILSASPLLRPFCQPHGPRKKENPPQSLLKKGMKKWEKEPFIRPEALFEKRGR